MEFAENNATPGMDAACESVQNNPVILLPLYERVVDILERHSEYVRGVAATRKTAEAA